MPDCIRSEHVTLKGGLSGDTYVGEKASTLQYTHKICPEKTSQLSYVQDPTIKKFDSGRHGVVSAREPCLLRSAV